MGLGLRNILQHVKGPSSRLFLRFAQVPMDFMRSWVDMLRGVGLRNVIFVGLVRSLLSIFFLSVRHMIPKDKNFLTIRSKSLLQKHSKLSIAAAFR